MDQNIALTRAPCGEAVGDNVDWKLKITLEKPLKITWTRART
jgi:hypothetical protein